MHLASITVLVGLNCTSKTSLGIDYCMKRLVQELPGFGARRTVDVLVFDLFRGHG